MDQQESQSYEPTTIEELIYHYSSCRDESLHTYDGVYRVSYSSDQCDAMLDPRVDEVEIQLSLLEDRQAKLYMDAMDEMMECLKTSRYGIRGACGCFRFELWPPSQDAGGSR